MTKPASQLVGTPDAALSFAPVFIFPNTTDATAPVDCGSIGPRSRVVISEAFSTIPAGSSAEVVVEASASIAFSSVFEVCRVRFGDDASMARNVRGTVAVGLDLAHVGDGAELPETLRYVRLRGITPESVTLGLGGSITAESHQ